ncbi:MAG: hypothetical protein FJX42_12530, partial [Alphaproteobacteria bacterium]|nr:hypothetical protein [Alphaproteobacteria bacterium]
DAGGLPYAILAFLSALVKILLNRRPLRPMISYRAQRKIETLLRPDWVVAEFGSGFSTPWLARRCAFLLSIEDNPAWHERVESLLARNKIANVRHELRDKASYASLDDYPRDFFDFILIDGSDRAGCVAAATSRLKPGGWIYLDNTDKDMTTTDGDLRRAESALIAAVRERGGTLVYYTDFSPTNFFAEQGLLARL